MDHYNSTWKSSILTLTSKVLLSKSNNTRRLRFTEIPIYWKTFWLKSTAFYDKLDYKPPKYSTDSVKNSGEEEEDDHENLGEDHRSEDNSEVEEE